MCSCTIFAFERQNAAKKDVPVKCCLLAFNIVALGPVVSLELFVSRAYVASYHAYHIYLRPIFPRRSRSFTSRKRHVSVERFLCFFHQFFTSSMNRLIAPFVPSGTT